MREKSREREIRKVREAGVGCNSKGGDQGRPYGEGDL